MADIDNDINIGEDAFEDTEDGMDNSEDTDGPEGTPELEEAGDEAGPADPGDAEEEFELDLSVNVRAVGSFAAFSAGPGQRAVDHMGRTVDGAVPHGSAMLQDIVRHARDRKNGVGPRYGLGPLHALQLPVPSAESIIDGRVIGHPIYWIAPASNVLPYCDSNMCGAVNVAQKSVSVCFSLNAARDSSSFSGSSAFKHVKTGAGNSVQFKEVWDPNYIVLQATGWTGKRAVTRNPFAMFDASNSSRIKESAAGLHIFLGGEGSGKTRVLRSSTADVSRIPIGEHDNPDDLWPSPAPFTMETVYKAMMYTINLPQGSVALVDSLTPLVFGEGNLSTGGIPRSAWPILAQYDAALRQAGVCVYATLNLTTGSNAAWEDAHRAVGARVTGTYYFDATRNVAPLADTMRLETQSAYAGQFLGEYGATGPVNRVRTIGQSRSRDTVNAGFWGYQGSGSDGMYRIERRVTFSVPSR